MYKYLLIAACISILSISQASAQVEASLVSKFKSSFAVITDNKLNFYMLNQAKPTILIPQGAHLNMAYGYISRTSKKNKDCGHFSLDNFPPNYKSLAVEIRKSHGKSCEIIVTPLN